ncbi:MAG: hypothetical protein RL616_625 [Verrucomicrobiota bacterium]
MVWQARWCPLLCGVRLKTPLPPRCCRAAGFFCLLLAAFCWLNSTARALAEESALTGTNDWVFEATNHIGVWIWETNRSDKQTVRFWKAFEIPAGAKISRAMLRISVDNGYTLFLDGREIGRGAYWRSVTEYDVSQLMYPGPHRIAVEGFNDGQEAGMIFGLHIELRDQPMIDVVSDASWWVVPESKRKWTNTKNALPGWHSAIVAGPMRQHPWEIWPVSLAVGPALLPIEVHFWQTVWFQISVLTLLLLVVVVCLWLLTQLSAQTQAQKFLQVERARIARDIHDDLGAQVTQLLLLGEVAQREQPENSPARGQFSNLCEHARQLATALDEVVWAVNSRRDTVRDFTSYVCKYAQIFLSATNIRCRLDVEAEIPSTPFDLPVRRNLFLAVKEALNNAAKHSAADELFLRIYRTEKILSVAVEDNGRGFDPSQTGGERNGMSNMVQRMAEIGGTCALSSQPGGGCLIVFTVPLPSEKRRWFRRQPDEDGTNKIENPRAET